MARVKLQITRRTFLKSAAAGAGGVALTAMLPQPGMAAAPPPITVSTPWYRRGEIKTTYNVCDMCPWRCGIVVKTVDGVVQKIDGNPKDPKSRGMLCARGQGGVSFMYDPDRLQAPMLRTGRRGEGKFKEVTWTEALDETADKLAAIRDKYGPESVAIFGHTGGDYWFADYFAQAFGTPNAAKPSSSLCTSPREEAAKLTYGLAIGGHEPVDWDGINCIVLIGSHIGEDARNTVMQDFSNAWARGAKVIVVDPRFSSVAAKADYWLPIKPGTDTALVLAWLNVLISENRYDADYVAQWTEGFDQLAAHVKEYTPEWAAAITDLDAELIRTTARVMAENLPKAAIIPGRNVTWYGNDTQRMRAIYMVNALLGAYGREGGFYFSKAPYIEEYPHPPFLVAGSSGGCSAEPGEEAETLPLGPTGKARADGARDTFLRGATAMQELIEPMITGKPYPIKALIIYGCNALNSIPNTARTIEAFKKLDFILVVDVLPQEHVAWADVVMPEATILERYDDLWTVAHKTPYIAMREPAVEAMYDTKPAWWMVRELGLRLGMENYFKWETAEEFVNTRLVSIGSSLDKMRAEEGVLIQKGKPYLADFGTSSPFTSHSQKIEFYAHELALAGLDPIPVYEPVAEPPQGYFRLLFGRNPVHTFAKTQNTPLLNELISENEVWLNAQSAVDRGIQDGQRVWLENLDGVVSLPVKVKVTQRIRPDAVYMVHGFGQEAPGLTNANGKGASDNKLTTRYKLDPISGGAGMRINFVRINTQFDEEA
ncbi:MAG: molybdopterin-dependent oxidoreductase [Caldilineaceae bacterium]|nr:molybdopterin-dependent oxidoreductase [Caldilineaceae bacterium]MBP8109393.1 molybdopterin-dependent oxidoreductase [Caldilineaceae bacterium]MBP8124268.1 molybdopterin-dependent oxidoreductase [Caldilineaceae bacterium]MBP9074244.1 molybdopterin-dependent oxidoreductase [Caldilineaceae bacterium]